jgi:hypothetical protein
VDETRPSDLLTRLAAALDRRVAESPARAEIHWTLIRAVGGGEHGACLLDPTGGRRWTALASPAAVAELDRMRRRLVAGAGGPDRVVAALLDRARDRLLMGALAPDPTPAREVLSEAMATTLSVGRTALGLDGRLAGAHEIQRSGFLDGAEWIGDLFGPMLVIGWAARAGMEVADACERVLASRQGRDLRHYRDCPQLPHDADVAAAVLDGLAVSERVGEGGKWARGQARSILAAATDDDGEVRTWVDRPGDLPRVADHRWLGPTCSGVGGRALAAMAGDVGGFGDPRVKAVAGWLGARADDDGGFTGVHYPERVVATSLALSGLVAARRRLGPGHGLGSPIARAAGWLVERQQPDGRMGGGALATAMAVLAVDEAFRCAAVDAPADTLAEPWADALALLALTQRWDGGWPAEGLYPCPHPGGRVERFGAVALTTAASLAALTVIRRVWGS